MGSPEQLQPDYVKKFKKDVQEEKKLEAKKNKSQLEAFFKARNSSVRCLENGA